MNDNYRTVFDIRESVPWVIGLSLAVGALFAAMMAGLWLTRSGRAPEWVVAD